MKRTLILLACLVLMLLFTNTVFASTYTVCSYGCNYTTISGAFSGLDLAPDDILEVRADTPGGSKTYSETIQPSSNDGGSSGHPVIVKARSGDSITISGSTYGLDLRTNSIQYITIDGFIFTDPSSYVMFVGTSGNETDSNPTINGITIQNCTITGSTNNAIYFNKVNGGLIKNNVISTVSGDVDAQSDGIDLYRGANTIVDGNVITINNGNNTNHIDGVQSDYEDNVTVINNKITHANSGTSNKQFIYLSDVDGYAKVYNNVLIKPSGNTGSNMLSLNLGTADVSVYNNTLYATGANSGIATNLTGLVDIQNNIVIVSGNIPGIWLRGGTQTKSGIHHNIVKTDAGGESYYRDASSFYSLTAWKAAGGGAGDINSISTWNGNYAPIDGSVAIDNGVSKSTVFTTDIIGNSRSQGAAWDIGAYEYNGLTGLTTVKPSPPILH